MKIFVKDAETGHRITMDVEEDNTINEVIESAADYWNKEPRAYVVRLGKRILSGNATIQEVSIAEGDTLELIPDPEGG